MVGVWPALPIVIWDTENFRSDDDNIIAALEHRGRVCEIKLRCLTSSQSKTLVPLMQESFPALTKLQIQSCLVASNGLLVLADSFLGGSAPHLRFLCLESISFPAFPNLLRSASNLVYLYLDGTPSRYISPEMVAALSTLSKLEVMHILFRHPDFDSDSDLEDRAPSPLTRSVLPALKVLVLGGDTEYLDDFVARIDVPSINSLRIEFINRPFFAGDFFHLPQFIGRIKNFPPFGFAKFHLSRLFMNVILSPQKWTHGSCPGDFQLMFICDAGGPLAYLVEVFNTSLMLPISNIENVDISSTRLNPNSRSEFNTEDSRWLEVLRQISGAKSLFLGSMDLVPPVAFALKRVVEEGMTDALPAIQELTVLKPLSAGPVREAIEQFVTARGLSAFGTPPSSKWRISTRDTREE